jgi:hypothetical protein
MLGFKCLGCLRVRGGGFSLEALDKQLIPASDQGLEPKGAGTARAGSYKT